MAVDLRADPMADPIDDLVGDGLVVEDLEALVAEVRNQAAERKNCGVHPDGGALVQAVQDEVELDKLGTVTEVAAEVPATHSSVVPVHVRAPSAKGRGLMAPREPLQDLTVREQKM